MNIKEVFHAATIGQVELALEAELDQATISRWVSGIKIRDKSLAKIQAAVMRIAQRRCSQLNELLV